MAGLFEGISDVDAMMMRLAQLPVFDTCFFV